MAHDGHDHAHDHGHSDDHGAHNHTHPPAQGPWQPPARQLARGAGAGCVLYVDAFCGAAGDMLVAALLDLGVPQEAIEGALAGLKLESHSLMVTGRSRSGIAAAHVEVIVEGRPASRTHADIRAMIEAAALPPGARTLALRAFEILAQAESEIHNMPIERVHFHEVGAVDSIVDIVAVAFALDYLGAEVVSSALPLGHGTVRAQHGVLPLPAPATVLCLRGIPTRDGGIAAELVTPTGACLLAAAAIRFGGWPAMRPIATGWGAGTKDFAERPNLLRLVLGERVTEGLQEGDVVLLETNLDDSTPEVCAHALERALDEGALDAWWAAVGMKKSRAGIVLSVLARPDMADHLARLLLTETSALGVRRQPMRRWERTREIVEVSTAYGTIRIKVGRGDDLPVNRAPELEDCRAAAKRHNVPLKDVYAAAAAAAMQLADKDQTS